MESRGVGVRWRRAGAAAMRLAALYAVGAAFLLVPVTLLLEGAPPFSRDLAWAALPFGVLFLLAFVVLVLARRVGLAAMWILLVTLWIWLLFAAEGSNVVLCRLFVGWSSMAAPLFAIGALGVRGDRVARATHLPRPLVVSIAWMLFAGVALYYASQHVYLLEIPSPFLTSFSRLALLPAPFALAALELMRVWLGTSPAAREARLHN